ncbi:hypothetical protein [Sphingobium cupriresistens]|uniref:Uncharacterized protein n=1 Tax=Sphingobium cupriresistens TaxID=1132417 RepID=A0A8G2DWP2_9SPHN|nr:hypothetical protein [Sphingobium cupriresistens]RYM11013.1 hypothetical protein EWH12_09910 [Sphingobium cupriresistens]
MDMANTSGASAPNHGARLFDPAEWVASYVDLGGGYTVTGASCCLHSVRGLSWAEQAALAAHQLPILADPSKREAVRAYLTSGCLMEALS